ncbi:uncharacterized protein YbaR (Trm112 family) [Kitasatospora gansuensis]|uniref:Uncharacterized protein YbaR (Trm112 family) n=1 Tax=Kitasatospora gansuensis TaxID=258050 RepID=A0A7W7SKD6_9ACTN|nr:hypothetical protein [Kitasatospora gansuensis]MBB4951503.1 uncharacterized protein YbaR (Trm112 family) [Kitasatospora gansuensis]
MTNTDRFATEADPDHGPVCPRCEESTRLSLFEEHRRPVRRSANPLPLLAATAVGLYGVALLESGNLPLGTALLGCGLAAGALALRAQFAARSAELAQVLYCHQCLARFPSGADH